MSAEALAGDLRRTVIPVLPQDAVDFLDTYFDAGEWEIVIGMTAETALLHDLDVPAEALEYADDMPEDVATRLRQRLSAV